MEPSMEKDDIKKKTRKWFDSPWWIGKKTKMENLCGFRLKDLSSLERFTALMYRPMDPSSLGITRILFGFFMVFDIPEERGGGDMDLRWGEPRDCHFPLISFIRPMPLAYMGLVYAIMFIGAVGITLGYKFRISATIFSVTYWYVFLIEKSFWNNHSYLFGLVSILLIGSCSNHYLSIDAWKDKSIRNKPVPLWNYFILRFQFFLLYFYAGLKKFNLEWLEGYAMTNLSQHWVFDPFKFIFTIDQIDYLFVHWFGFLFDLSVGFWLLFEKTRMFAMLFCASFHFMNSRLFSIGMFPYVCLATMPLFCSLNWPQKMSDKIKKISSCLKGNEMEGVDTTDQVNTLTCRRNSEKKLKVKQRRMTWKQKLVVGLLLTYCGVQLFLPYSHFITKGYNNWTNGLYGYSWDMMVHAWNTVLVVIKVVDNSNGVEHFLDPSAWTLNDRWSKHGDMMYQYAHCLRDNLVEELHQGKYNIETVGEEIKTLKSDDISIYIDVWCSLNGRFQQRMFNPTYDLLKVEWSPFKPIEWIMPLLTEFSWMRNELVEIQQQVYSWSNYTDVLFVADFPGLHLENYIAPTLTNMTLTILSGEVFLEIENRRQRQSFGRRLASGQSIKIRSGIFHKVHTVSQTPASYMYTYVNQTQQNEASSVSSSQDNFPKFQMKSPFPLLEDIDVYYGNFQRMFSLIFQSISNLVFGTPINRRVKQYN